MLKIMNSGIDGNLTATGKTTYRVTLRNEYDLTIRNIQQVRIRFAGEICEISPDQIKCDQMSLNLPGKDNTWPPQTQMVISALFTTTNAPTICGAGTASAMMVIPMLTMEFEFVETPSFIHALESFRITP